MVLSPKIEGANSNLFLKVSPMRTPSNPLRDYPKCVQCKARTKLGEKDGGFRRMLGWLTWLTMSKPMC